jgi:cytochrome c oxidase subunit 2
VTSGKGVPVRNRHLSRFFLLASLLTVAVLLSGCGYFDSPQNVFAPHGQVAQDQKNLFFLTMWPALGVLALVEIGLLYIVIRFRHKKGDDGLPVQTHGNNTLEIGWTIAPIIMMAFFVPAVVGGIVDLGRTPKNSLVVDVTAVQWQWLFAYPVAGGGAAVQGTANELHIPINKTIDIQLKSGTGTNDVIHSFWVPKLAGKTDVIPGRANHMWIKGTDAGTYEGQCAEFCGIGHAEMRFKVVVESQADFDAFLKQQAAAQQGQDQPALAFHGE